ncbi:MAG: hypothetical protein GY777_04505 [Candidatus Brocadiaceae bacterium]|nr:hypothetical protein [Candidatus Brocadiaceae bacterium]
MTKNQKNNINILEIKCLYKKEMQDLTIKEKLDLPCCFDIDDQSIKIFDEKTETWVNCGEKAYRKVTNLANPELYDFLPIITRLDKSDCKISLQKRKKPKPCTLEEQRTMLRWFSQSLAGQICHFSNISHEDYIIKGFYHNPPKSHFFYKLMKVHRDLEKAISDCFKNIK